LSSSSKTKPGVRSRESFIHARQSEEGVMDEDDEKEEQGESLEGFDGLEGLDLSSPPHGGLGSSASSTQRKRKPKPHESRSQYFPDNEFVDGAAEENADGPDGTEPCSLFDYEFPPVSEADKWCFMRDAYRSERDISDHKGIQQFFYFQRMWGFRDEYRVCLAIQKWYEHKQYDKKYKHKWTLNSIRNWCKEVATEAQMRANVLRMVYQKISNISDKELCRRNTRTGEKLDCADSDHRMQTWIKTFQQFSTGRR
jgi:hypothetical protein